MSESSLFERLGGEGALDAAVDLFYGRVMADPRINYLFAGVDLERQRAKQKAFLTYAFGGPNKYTGRGMRAGHARLNLTEEHFNAVMENLGGTLEDLRVPDTLIAEAAAIAMSVKDDVLNR
jgi:hemoglobin